MGNATLEPFPSGFSIALEERAVMLSILQT